MPATPATADTQQAGATSTAPITTTVDGAAQTPQEEVEKTIRLHITPFTPALCKVYLAPSILPLAKNISYHAVQTFPEKGFGYVELPAMEAQKLKKKLKTPTSIIVICCCLLKHLLPSPVMTRCACISRK